MVIFDKVFFIYYLFIESFIWDKIVIESIGLVSGYRYFLFSLNSIKYLFKLWKYKIINWLMKILGI